MKNSVTATIIAAVIAITAIVGTVMAMADRYINAATFKEFKEHILYRLDAIDDKLDRLIEKKPQS